MKQAQTEWLVHSKCALISLVSLYSLQSYVNQTTNSISLTQWLYVARICNGRSLFG